MPVMEDVDVLREVERGPVPPRVARRARLLALRAEALARVREGGLVQARASWRIAPLACPPGCDGSLCIDGWPLHAPWLVPAAGQLTAVACAAATLGERVEREVSALFAQRRAALAVALDGVANELLFALSRRVQDRVLAEARRQGLGVAGELRAGDPGLDLQEQVTVLHLAGGAAIGIALTRTSMMSPAKSTTFVQGVGAGLPPQTWSRCDSCRSRAHCTLARASG